MKKRPKLRLPQEFVDMCESFGITPDVYAWNVLRELAANPPSEITLVSSSSCEQALSRDAFLHGFSAN